MNTNIGVVIPCRNEEHNIQRIVKGYLAQSCVDRLLLIDDGSTDDTPDLIAEAWKNEPRVLRITNNASRGVAACNNQGLQEVGHLLPWLYFGSANDGVADLQPLAAAGRTSWVTYVSGRVRFQDGRKTWLSTDTPHCGGILWNAEHVKTIGGFNPALRSLCDHYLVRQLEHSCVSVQDEIVTFHVNKNSEWWSLEGTAWWYETGKKYFPGDPLFTWRHRLLRRVKDLMPWWLFNPIAKALQQ